MQFSTLFANAAFFLSLQTAVASPVLAEETSITGQPQLLNVKAKRDLSSDEQQALKLHNDARAAVGVPALEWDAGLAADALAWAQHLISVGHLEHSSGSGQGENLSWGSSAGANPITDGTKMWTDEVSKYHGEIIPQGDFESYGHYTQVVWRSTTKVGVAWVGDGKGGFYTVGRYSPPGNYVGQTPY